MGKAPVSWCSSQYVIISKLFLHLCRINLDSNSLLPAMNYPVPVGTPMISPLVMWDHAQTWDIPKAEHFIYVSGGSNSATIYNIGI